MNDKFNIRLETLQLARALLFDPALKPSERNKAKKEQFLLKVPLLALIHQKKGSQNFQTIIEHARLVQANFGEVVFSSQENRTFNIILRGNVMLFTKDKKEEPKLFKKLGPGECFGERFTFGRMELESARSASQCWLLQMDMAPFYHAFAGHFQFQQLTERIELLKRVWVFSNLTSAFLERMLLRSETKQFVRGHVLFREGESADYLLAILSGEVTLYTTQEGKPKPFTILSEFQACGVEEILEEEPYSCLAICTSDYCQILRVEKATVFQIFSRDIDPQTIRSRKKLSSELKEKQSPRAARSRTKSCAQEERQGQVRKSSLQQRRLKTDCGDYKPLDKMAILNKLFEREVQLKYAKIRPIRLQFIKNSQKQTFYSANRISSYTNKECTYDKQIILSYLERKERRYQQALRKELQFQTQKIPLVPELRVDRSLAVKTHKRRLKNSRKSHHSSLDNFL